MKTSRAKLEAIAETICDRSDRFLRQRFVSAVVDGLGRRDDASAATGEDLRNLALADLPAQLIGTVRAPGNWPHRAAGPSPPAAPSVSIPLERVDKEAIKLVQTLSNQRSTLTGRLGSLVARAISTPPPVREDVAAEIQDDLVDYWAGYSDLDALEAELRYVEPKDEERGELRALTIQQAGDVQARTLEIGL
jgi:hypothetical protein